MNVGVFKRSAAPATPVRKTSIVPIEVGDVLGKIKQLPSLSETIVRAMAISNDDNYRFNEFIDVIKRDGAITSLLLKVANSIIMGGTKTVQTVDQAVIRIGMKQVNRIITTVGMKGALRPKNPDIANRVDILWRHSLLTAYVASQLNAHLKTGFTGQEYTAALLHDIGRIVLLISNDRTAKRVDPLTFREPADILEKERSLMGTDHCELGMEYAVRQSFPHNVCQVIRYHHTPIGADADTKLLTDLVAAADHLTNYALSERRVSDYDFHSCPSFPRLLASKPAAFVDDFPFAIGDIIKAATRETREALRAAD
jgi:HD-like signal output (HDOD) protein